MGPVWIVSISIIIFLILMFSFFFITLYFFGMEILPCKCTRNFPSNTSTIFTASDTTYNIGDTSLCPLNGYYGEDVCGLQFTLLSSIISNTFVLFMILIVPGVLTGIIVGYIVKRITKKGKK